MPTRITELNSFFNWLNKKERYIFFILVLLNAVPLFLSKFYLTHDGPAHLYNSVLLRELIFGKDVSTHNVFELNHTLVPNMISHILMAGLSAIFPLWFAEKIVLLTYFIGLPYLFRFFLSKLSAPTIFSAVLIIPFTYSYFLYMGFYNFLLALLPFFMFLTLWSKPNQNKSFSFGFQLFICLLFLYFSHVYVFALGLFLAGFHSCILFLQKFRKESIKLLLVDLTFLFVVSLPLLILFSLFISKIPIDTLPIQPSFKELARALLDLSALNRPGEFVRTFTSKIALILGAFVVCGIILRFLKFKRKQQPLFNATDNWLLAVFLLLILYFTVPDYIGGGMNCLRIQQLLAICTIVWIGLQKFPRVINVFGIGCILLLQMRLVCYYASENKYADEINEWVEAGKHIDKGTLTLPIVFSNNDLWLHSSGYLGATASLTLYANYEAGLQWFPIIWNNNYMVRLKGLTDRNPLTDDRNPAIVWMNKPILYPDNVVVWDQPKNVNDSLAFRVVDSILQKDFKLAYQSRHLKLFKQKK